MTVSRTTTRAASKGLQPTARKPSSHPGGVSTNSGLTSHSKLSDPQIVVNQRDPGDRKEVLQLVLSLAYDLDLATSRAFGRPKQLGWSKRVAAVDLGDSLQASEAQKWPASHPLLELLNQVQQEHEVRLLLPGLLRRLRGRSDGRQAVDRVRWLPEVEPYRLLNNAGN